MAILRNDTVMRSADGQTMSAMVTAANIGTYGVAANSTYYVGTTQNVFNRASGAQALTGVSIDGNAATVSYPFNNNNALDLNSTGTTNQFSAFNVYYPSGGSYNQPLAGSQHFKILQFGRYNADDPNYWRGQMAMSFYTDRMFFRKEYLSTWGSWMEFLHTGNYAGYSAFTTSLTSTVDARAPIFYDSNDTTYYIDPASTSRVVALWVRGSSETIGNIYVGGTSAGNRLNISYDQIWTPTAHLYLQYSGAGNIDMNYGGGVAFSRTSLRAPIFYDFDNTAYYTDPASTSSLNALTMAGTITGALDSTISFAGGACTAASYNYILSGANDGGNKLVIFVNGTTRSADGGVNALTIRNDGGTFVLGYAPYLTSILGSSVTINGNVALHAGNYGGYSAFSGSISSGGNITATGYVNVNSYVYSATYLQTGGNLIYPSGFSSTQRLEVGNSANNNWIDGLTIAPGGTVTAPDNMRSPIFYDSNNTAYYLDPANTGTSLLVAGKVGIGTTSPTSLLHLAGVGGDGGAFLRIAGTASDAFNWGSSVMYANLTATETAINLIGKAQSQYNCSYIGYRHVADGSALNMLSLGLYAADHLVNILGNGNVGIGTTSPANKLHVVGSAYSDTDFRAPIFYDSNDTGYFLNPNSTSNLNNLRAATISAANHGLTCVYYGGGATPTNGYLITTNIDYSTFNMPTVIIEGYAYGNGVPIHLEIVWYAYNNSWTNLSYTNLGAWNPGTVSIGTNASGKVCLHLSSLIYYGRFNVRCIYDQGNAPLEGWTVTDATTSALTRVTTISKVELATSITGNAATVTNGLYTSSTLTAGNLSGTIPSGVLGNSAHFIGTTSIALNRASASQTLTGVSIDGNAATVTTNANLTGHITSVGNATSLGSFTSAQLLAALTDETGTGANVFATSPTLVTPILGTPTSGNLANCTFPTLNQNTTGTSSNITAYTINQNVGSSNSPTFATLQLTRLNFGATGATPYAAAAGEGTGNGITFGGDEAGAGYRIFTSMENWNGSGNYSKLTLNWHTGIKIGAYTVYGGIRFYNNAAGATNPTPSEIFSIGRGDSNVRVENNLIVNGITINQERANNARIYGAGTGAFGLLGLDSAGSFRWQVYGESGNYGFLDSTWGAWDIKKVPNGELDLRVSSANVRVLNAGNYSGYSAFTASLTSTVDARAPIFYDSNNTAYYIDGASGSKLKYLQIDGDWGGSPFGSGHESFTIRSTYASMVQRQTNGGLGYWLHHIAGDAAYYLYGGKGATDGSSWDWSYRAYPNQDGSYVEFRTSARAPLFYDSNDTNYYVDPNGTSSLYNLSLVGAKNTYLIINPGNGSEAMVRYIGGSGSGWYVGKRMSSQLVGTADFHFFSEAAGATIGGIDTSGNIFSSGSVRSPIFYDSNNTAYYTDPASTSNLLGLTVTNTITGSITGNAGGSSTSCSGNAASASYANEIIITNLGTATVSINNGRTAIYRNENGLGAALAYSPVLHAGAGDTMWQVQGTYGSSGNGTFYFRQGYQGVFGNWLTMLSSANYNSYAPTLTGTGASGTWSINVTGNAGGSSASCTGNSATTTLATKATRANGDFYIDDNFGNTIVGLYSPTKYQGVFTMGNSYKLAVDGSGTGNLYGIAWSHPNAGGVAANLSDHGALIIQNGAFSAAISSSIRCTVDMRTPIYYDSNDTAYYVNPNSETRLYKASIYAGNEASNTGANGSTEGLILRGNYNSNTWAKKFHNYDNGSGIQLYLAETVGTGAWSTLQGWGTGLGYTSRVFGSFAADSALYSPIFYDTGNTAYYCDPAGSSNFSIVTAADFYTAGWFRNNTSGYGIYNQVTAQHFYSDTANYWNVASSASAQGIRLRTGGYAGTVRGYFYADTANDVGLLNNAGNWRVRVVGGDYVLFDGSSIRAQIFYDSNDTGYYTDPAGTSILNVVRANSYVQKSASQSLSGTVGCTIDVAAADIHVLTLAASTTISSFTYNYRAPNPSANTTMLVIKYGGTASITWTNVLWANGVTPTITGASGYADVYMLTSYQGTTGVWIGTVVAQGLVSTSL